MLTLIATRVSLPVFSKSFAFPSKTSPKAPEPKNFVKVIWSLLMCGNEAISASVGGLQEPLLYKMFVECWNIPPPPRDRGSSLRFANSTSTRTDPLKGRDFIMEVFSSLFLKPNRIIIYCF